eukprot:341609-Rhodomonas_salina.4
MDHTCLAGPYGCTSQTTQTSPPHERFTLPTHFDFCKTSRTDIDRQRLSLNRASSCAQKPSRRVHHSSKIRRLEHAATGRSVLCKCAGRQRPKSLA